SALSWVVLRAVLKEFYTCVPSIAPRQPAALSGVNDAVFMQSFPDRTKQTKPCSGFHPLSLHVCFLRYTFKTLLIGQDTKGEMVTVIVWATWYGK
ncbi:hypothetical protein BaRGS_00021619, partial [Batillaria attramentaria]